MVKGRPSVELKIVVAGILKDENSQVLIAQRPRGRFMEGYWEFPGGKLEKGESPEEGLIRELKEELDVEVLKKDLSPFRFISHSYEGFHILMPVYIVKKWKREINGKESQNLRWVSLLDFAEVSMLPADIPLIEELRKEHI